MCMNAEEIKKDFPILENRREVYLDSGATTQKPVQVIEAIRNYYNKNNANPHRGAYSLSIMGNLSKGDEIVLSIMEHHSNLVPWQKVVKETGAKLNYMYLNEEYDKYRDHQRSDRLCSLLFEECNADVIADDTEQSSAESEQDYDLAIHEINGK